MNAPGRTVVGVALAIGLAACASPAPTFYTLMAPPVAPGGVPPRAEATTPNATEARRASGLPSPATLTGAPGRAAPPGERAGTPAAVVLAELRLPDWLDRPQVALPGADGRLLLDDSRRWGEPLAAGLERVVAARLRGAAPGTWVALARLGGPMPAPADRIAIALDDVAAIGTTLTVQARWAIRPAGEAPAAVPGASALQHQATLTQRLDGTSAEAVVAAWSRLADDLGERIARSRTTAP